MLKKCIQNHNNDTFYILLFKMIGENPNGECTDRIDGDTVNVFIQNRFVQQCNASAETMQDHFRETLPNSNAATFDVSTLS